MENVLLIGAHYDDVDLAAGGTAARLSAEGKNVFKLTLTDNYVEASQFNQYTSAESSERQNKEVCRILGISDIDSFQKRPNCKLEYSKEFMQDIEAVIIDKNIDTVFIHSEYDMNHDHIRAAEVCKVAARHVRNIYSYRSNIYVTETAYCPHMFFDITQYVDVKRKALNVYGKEHDRVMANGDNTLFESVFYQNRIWGYAIDALYAEGFEVIKEVR